MSWADKLRAEREAKLAAEAARTPSPPPTIPPPPPPAAASSDGTTVPANNYVEGTLRTPGEAWMAVLEYLSAPDALRFGAVCKYFRKITLVDHVWSVKQRQFEFDFAVSQGYQTCKLARMGPERLPPRVPPHLEASIGSIRGRRIEHFWEFTRFHARDAARQWTLVEHAEEQEQRRQQQRRQEVHGWRYTPENPAAAAINRVASGALGAPKCVTRVLPLPTNDSSGDLVQSAEARIQLEELHLFMVDRGEQESAPAGKLLSLFDSMSSQTETRCGLDVMEITDTEDPVWVMALLQSLCPPHNRSLLSMLRLRPSLVEINLGEAIDLVETGIEGCVGAMLDCVVNRSRTRFFCGPELCQQNRLGILLVDPMRVVLFVWSM